MPNGDPLGRFFYPTLTLMIDSLVYVFSDRVIDHVCNLHVNMCGCLSLVLTSSIDWFIICECVFFSGHNHILLPLCTFFQL